MADQHEHGQCKSCGACKQCEPCDHCGNCRVCGKPVWKFYYHPPYWWYVPYVPTIPYIPVTIPSIQVGQNIGSSVTVEGTFGTASNIPVNGFTISNSNVS